MGARVTARRRPETRPLTLETAVLAAVEVIEADGVGALTMRRLAGRLGLGVMEPLPSWGNLLRGLEDFSAVSTNPWRLSPLILLVLVVICFQLILPAPEEIA